MDEHMMKFFLEGVAEADRRLRDAQAVESAMRGVLLDKLNTEGFEEVCDTIFLEVLDDTGAALVTRGEWKPARSDHEGGYFGRALWVQLRKPEDVKHSVAQTAFYGAFRRACDRWDVGWMSHVMIHASWTDEPGGSENNAR